MRRADQFGLAEGLAEELQTDGQVLALDGDGATGDRDAADPGEVRGDGV